MSRRLVLLSNDDGYRAEGLLAMRRALSAVADVVVCAPDSEQSAASHALTLHRPLRLVEREPGLFSVDGTPADCVYVALHSEGRVLPRRPDVVVSGLNHGVNLGDDIFYSGTVAAAREGALKGVPSLAASADARADRESAAALSARLALAIAALTLDRPVLLNINFPPGDRWGLRATRIGTRLYTDAVEFRRDPRDREYVWLAGPCVEHPPIAGSDTEAYDEGVVGMSPLTLDLWERDEQELSETLVEGLLGADAADR